MKQVLPAAVQPSITTSQLSSPALGAVSFVDQKMKEVGPTEAAPSLKHDNQRNSDQDIHASNHHAETKIGSEFFRLELGMPGGHWASLCKGYPQIDHAGAENSFLPNVQKCT